MRVPFNHPVLAGREVDYMLQAIRNEHISGDGAFGQRCQALLQQELGVRKVLLTTSCTDALEMAALLLGLEPGDEVIVPSFSFVSTANAFVLRGAAPRFADIRRDTLNMDENQLESLLTDRTKAIVLVHYAGVACEMDRIVEIAAKRAIPVVEDNAHGLFARYKGKYLGTFGCLATQSFHETKNFTCGEGGALVINDGCYSERAEILREKGTNRNRFFRGEVDKYTWVDVGSSFLPSDLVAAFLYAQLEERDRIQATRHRAWESYRAGLASWAEDCGIALPTVPPSCEHAAHLFYLLLPSSEDRDQLMNHLRAREIAAVFHYQPLHLSVMGRAFGGSPGLCPVTEQVSDCLLRLPLFNDITDEQVAAVVAALLQFRTRGYRRIVASGVA